MIGYLKLRNNAKIQPMASMLNHKAGVRLSNIINNDEEVMRKEVVIMSHLMMIWMSYSEDAVVK
jgi:hypothetical protein